MDRLVAGDANNETKDKDLTWDGLCGVERGGCSLGSCLTKNQVPSRVARRPERCCEWRVGLEEVTEVSLAEVVSVRSTGHSSGRLTTLVEPGEILVVMTRHIHLVEQNVIWDRDITGYPEKAPS